MMKYCIMLFIPLIFLGCEKDELPIPPHDAGDLLEGSVDMAADYKWQIYYDLGTNSVVGKNLKTAWDLGFETGETENRIIVNSSKLMAAFNTGNTNFEAVTDTSGFLANRTFDAASGNSDTTAIDCWVHPGTVYIIDRGYNEIGVHQGFRKIMFLAYNEEQYSIRFAELNGNNDTNLQIVKNADYNFTFLSFATSGTLIIEPPKAGWDLVFTQYTHLFSEPEFTPYLVTGCLLNPNNTTATIDSISEFSAINFSALENYNLSENLNSIGYNWKTFTGSTYITNSNITYLIQDNTGFYYKLRFIDFYNAAGIKGNPVFEFQKL